TVGANMGQGAAYSFVQTGTSWVQEEELTANDGAANDQFGTSVWVSGDMAIIGAYNRNDGRGAAYVFAQKGTAWTQQAELVAGDATEGAYSGSAVSLSGGTAIIGAWRESVGAAYVFRQTGTDWTQQAELISNDGAAGDRFGVNVAVSGGTTIIGAPFHV